VLAVRHRANAPAGSAANVQSYTTTMTLDVMAAEHALSQIEPPAREPARHRPPPQQHRAGRPDR